MHSIKKINGQVWKQGDLLRSIWRNSNLLQPEGKRAEDQAQALIIRATELTRKLISQSRQVLCQSHGPCWNNWNFVPVTLDRDIWTDVLENIITQDFHEPSVLVVVVHVSYSHLLEDDENLCFAKWDMSPSPPFRIWPFPSPSGHQNSNESEVTEWTGLRDEMLSL